MKTYRRQITVRIPSGIPAEKHAAIHAKAAELNARFASDRYTHKKDALFDAVTAVGDSGYTACLIEGVVAVK